MPERPHQGGKLAPTPVPAGVCRGFVDLEAPPLSLEQDAGIEAALESFWQGVNRGRQACLRGAEKGPSRLLLAV